MSVKQILQLESESVSCQPVAIPFEFTRLESLPKGKVVGGCIVITPITVRTWFREVLKDNCTWEDIYILLNAILYRIGCNPFSRTIIALEAVSPLSEVEIIALQKNSETWKKKALKAASCS